MPVLLLQAVHEVRLCMSSAMAQPPAGAAASAIAPLPTAGAADPARTAPRPLGGLEEYIGKGRETSK